MSNIIYKNQLYCNTEQTVKYWYLPESDPLPTTCPTDSSHDINPDSVFRDVNSKVGDVQEVSIKSNDGTTGGSFFSQAHEFLALGPTGTLTEYAMTYPVNRSISLGDFVYSAEQRNDVISVCVAPHTTVGAMVGTITHVEASGSVPSYSIIPVSGTVPLHAKAGYYINLFDGVHRSSESCISEYNLNVTPNTMKVVPAIDGLGTTFNPGCYIQMTYYMIRERRLGPGIAHLEVGTSIIGGSTIPKTIPFMIRYMNNSAEPFVSLVLANVSIGDTTIVVDKNFLTHMQVGSNYFSLTDGTTTSCQLQFVNFDDTNGTNVHVTVSPAVDVALTYSAETPIKVKRSASKLVVFATEGTF